MKVAGQLFARAGRWLRWRAGFQLSRLGEALGVQSLVYNPLHFLSFHEHATRNAPGVMGAIIRVFPDAGSYLDVGAGSGAFAAEGKRLGKAVIAIEHSATGRRLGRKLGVDIRAFDLLRDPASVLPGNFDLAYCFEVAEHLPPDLGDRLVAFTAKHARLMVFTAAPPGQTGTGHINEQPKSYWIQKFESCGMIHRSDLTDRLASEFRAASVAPWFTQNVIVFERVEN